MNCVFLKNFYQPLGLARHNWFSDTAQLIATLTKTGGFCLNALPAGKLSWNFCRQASRICLLFLSLAPSNVLGSAIREITFTFSSKTFKMLILFEIVVKRLKCRQRIKNDTKLRTFWDLRINLFNSDIQLFCVKVGRFSGSNAFVNFLFLVKNYNKSRVTFAPLAILTK